METGTAIATVLSLIGGGLISYLGGWDTSLEFLFVFIILDILTGTLSSIVFGKSKHSRSGHFSSRVFTKGVVSKIGILCLVVVAVGLDRLLGILYIRDTVVLFFVFNEMMSILENAECMGLPIPNILRKTMDVYYSKIQNTDDENDPKSTAENSVKKQQR